jgi:hypothetical protein
MASFVVCLVEPTVTRISAEDDGLLPNATGMGDEDVSKPENGAPQDNGLKEDAPEHGRDSVNEVKAEQKNEPCSSSSSESDLQVVYDIHATSQVKLGAVCLDLEFDPQTHEKLLGMGWRGASVTKCLIDKHEGLSSLVPR